jgi:thymidylate synthase (FAD)
MQDTENRQNSLPCYDPALALWWKTKQRAVRRFSQRVYDAALAEGIAKEVARAVLPEGLTTSRMYMAGTIRSWVHYLDSRTSVDTQQEHREVACAIRIHLSEKLPLLFPTLLAPLGQSC